MKKIICFLCITALLWSCGGGAAAPDKELVDAVNDVNLQNKLSADYMLEISFNGNVLYFFSGDACWDRAQRAGNLNYTQTHLGNASSIKAFFDKGQLIHITDKQILEYQRDASVLLGCFPCLTLPLPTGKADLAESSVGRAYSFTLDTSKDLLTTLIGGDIYALVPAIKAPQRDKTQYSAAECIYTLSDGRLTSARIQLNLKLFDTPIATAEGLPEESKYTVDLKVTAKISYTARGEGVSVEKYSTPDEFLK